MKKNLELYDLILKDGWVIDPSQSLNGKFDIAIRNRRIVTISEQLPDEKAKRTINLDRRLVCPGFIDLHTHVYERKTGFGLAADDAGINSGVTTVADQGSSGLKTFADFKSSIIDKAQTDVRAFVLVNQAALQNSGVGISMLDHPENINVEALVNLAKRNPDTVRGFKIFAESGSLSRWGTAIIKLAREVGDRTNLPLYVHTGELFPVDETNRPDPDKVLELVLSHMKPGDVLGHCYSSQPDGVMGTRTQVSQVLLDAIDRGILLDLGHGLKFSFDIARKMMAQGVLPDIISSDVHGDFHSVHNDATLNYSLCGAVSKLIALGIDLEKAIATVTINPARVLKAEPEIGTLKVGSRADVTVLDRVEGDWLFYDCTNESIVAKQRLIPSLVVRAGKVIQPDCRLLRDLENPSKDQQIVAA